jgi:phage tail sheath protein FI
MAETLISPGVLTRENDSSQITQGPIEVGAAIIGPSIKGPVEVPTLVTSYSEYLAIFGGSVTSGSQQHSYLNQIAANNYFRQGGKTLLVTRVVSGSFTSAASSNLFAKDESGVIDTITRTSSLSLNSFNITSSQGNGPVPVSGVVTATAFSSTGDGTGLQITASFTTSESFNTITLQGGTGYVAGEAVTFTSQSLTSDKPEGTDLVITLSADNIINKVPFTLSTISEGEIMNNSGSSLSGGALVSGSKDNIRWEITNVNTSSGVFSLSVRRGDDTHNQKSILETFNNISLDPLATNYIESVIGNSYYGDIQQDGTDFYLQQNGSYTNKSKYIYVSNVNLPTPNYFDNAGNAKNQFTGSLPLVGSGSFAGATGNLFPGAAAQFNENISANNIQGIGANDYTASINLLTNKDDYQFNVLSAPGLIHEYHSPQVNLLVSTAETRQDCLSVIDLRSYGSSVGNTVDQASSFDSSYSATYWPWLQLVDPDSGRTIWAPASTLIPGVFAFTDASSDPWFAPAGLTRGGLGQVIRAERKLTSGNRDSLYEANINPIATFPQSGVVVFGQKTLQKKASALDRVNVRRLLISLKSFIGQVSDNLVFEQNTIATRNNFLTQVNPYLESVQQRQGLYAFKVVMDDSNNTPDVIDRNELIGQIYLQPTKTAEFIILDFNVLPTGATFPA